jgi:hypothetical protein
LIDWLGIAVGIAVGLLLCYWIGHATLARLVASSRNPVLLVKLSLGGTVVGLLPALLLSIAVGAPLGLLWGAVGIVIGVAAVFSVVLLAATFAGVVLARLLTRSEA